MTDTGDLLARLEALGANGPAISAGMAPVSDSADLRRIKALPRRGLMDPRPNTLDLRDLAKPGGTMTLRPLQAEALVEAKFSRGLLALIPTGEGKTLLSALLPTVMEADTAVILTKAALVLQTRDLIDSYRQHWHIIDDIHVLSYGSLSAMSGATVLEDLEPDLIIADECHKLKNPKAARTRRFVRYMRAHPETDFCALSGSLLSGSLMDLGHLGDLALFDGSPVPRHWPTLNQWATALDPGAERDPGALRTLQEEFGGDSARDGFRRRFVSCPGVVAGTCHTTDIQIERMSLHTPPVCAKERAQLAREWVLPDGTEILRAADFARNMASLRLGYFYRWEWPNGTPDYDWLEAYRGMGRAVNGFLRSRAKQGLDSPGLVVQAVREGRLAMPEYDAWARVDGLGRGPTPVVQAVGEAMGEVAAHISDQIDHGLILCQCPVFTTLLATMYYQDPGYLGSKVCVGSVHKLGTGRDDLKRYTQLVMVTPSPSPEVWEQAIGRIHRPGQLAGTIRVWHLAVFEDEYQRAYEAARHVEALTGTPQKILL